MSETYFRSKGKIAIYSQYSCVLFRFSGLSKSRYFPVIQIASDDLRVASENLEGHSCLWRIKLGANRKNHEGYRSRR